MRVAYGAQPEPAQFREHQHRCRLRQHEHRTVFGTPQEVTLSELAIESFFPADETTAQALRAMATASG